MKKSLGDLKGIKLFHKNKAKNLIGVNLLFMHKKLI